MTVYSNLRRNPFTAAYSWRVMDQESHTIAEYSEFPGQYGIQLQDRPKIDTVVIVEDNTGGDSFVEVTVAPLEGQFRVDYTGGYVFFNVADDAVDVTVDYEGGGSIANIENLEDIVDSPHAVLDTFIQYPIAASNDIAVAFPVAQRPATRFGGTWTRIYETEAIHWKTEGDFHVSETQNDSRTNGKQTHQTQEHIHQVSTFTNTASTTYPNRITGEGFNPVGTMDITAQIDDGTHGAPLTGYETRPQNRIMLLWKRTA